MAKKATKEVSKSQLTAHDVFENQLQSLGIGNSLRLAEEYDMAVECWSTGFPGLDRAIDERGRNLGLPRQRHSEWYSKNTHTGKTSGLLAIGAHWQRTYKARVGIVDLEESIDDAYLDLHGYVVRPDPLQPEIVPVRILRPQVKIDENTTEMVYLETVLDLVQKAANVFDLVVIDTADALVSEADALKSTEDNARTGGISKKLREWFRKNTTRRAHIAWINHANQNIGTSMPGMPPSYSTSGGKSIPRYSSLRVELTQIEKLKETSDSAPYGFVTRFQLVKNRLGPNWRYVDLYYIYGEGFSRDYDYFNQAMRLGIIWKQGAWYYFGGHDGDGSNEKQKIENRKRTAEWKAQGKLSAYRELKANPDLFNKIKLLIDGEDVVEVGVSEGDEAAVTAAEAE